MEKSWLFIFLLFTIGCQQTTTSTVKTFQRISGQTMGTTYAITYQSNQDIKATIERILKEVNLGVNHYDPNSVISKFNQATNTWQVQADALHQHFYTNLVAAKEIHEATKGVFDPTLMPLVNYWGFGYTAKRPVTKVDAVKVDSLLRLVGFDNILIQESSIRKSHPAMQLDFSALAKGYGVDQIGEALEAKGIDNYLVDIGGEVRAKGINKKGSPWRLGINTPNSEAAISEYLAVIELDNRSMATSGNYRNFYEVNGSKYAHTLNPTTGYPELNNLLSATVIAKDCMIADGYATAFMAMGLDSAYEIASNDYNLQAYFLYSKEDGTIGVSATEGMKEFIVE